MSWGVALRSAVGLGLGGIPSLLNAPPYAKLAFNFLSGELDPRITFSRASNATLIGSDGTLQYAPHNLLTYSEQFDNAAWGKTNASITSNSIAAPDGTTTGDTVIRSTGVAAFIGSSSGAGAARQYTMSLYAKAATAGNGVGLRIQGTFPNRGDVVFNLINGTISSPAVASGTATGASATITLAGGGWYRCTLTVTLADSLTICVFSPCETTAPAASFEAASAVASDCYSWGAQLNVGALQPYYQTVASAYYGPRFDYDPVTLAPKGLLIEEQRTNSLRNNTMIGAVVGTPGTFPTNWLRVENNSLIFTVVDIGTEDGIAYIDLNLSGTASAGLGCAVEFEQTGYLAASAGQTWALTSYVKIIGGSTDGINQIRLGWQERAGGFLASNFSVVTLQAGQKLSTARIGHVGTNANASTTSIKPYLFFVPTTGEAVDITVRIGMPQVELGAFATSVIPTTTTALTRAADVASVTGADFSNWYNPVEGTVYTEASALPDVNSSAVVYAISNGTLGESISGNFLVTGGVPGVRILTFDNGANQTNGIAQFNIASISDNTKDAFAYKQDDFGESVNGATTRTDSVGTLPTVNKLNIGSNWNASGFLNGHIRSFKYYPTRLSNGQLQALTK